MGNQASSVRVAAMKLAFEPRKKEMRLENSKIGILAFEVANVMAKVVQLWQSLSDQEILRLCQEAIKLDGVLNLVSDNECVLLSLACLEKVQDLTTVAAAVARLGRRCQEPALQGFEHVYNDILRQNIDVRDLEFPQKEMEAKVKKMERLIAGTSNLYQELEILSEMEKALRRAQNADDVGQKDNSYILEQKILWQRQEIKYLKDISLWNRTYDKIVYLLARTVCTTYGRIIGVLGFPVTGWPQILSISSNSEISQFPRSGNSQSFDFSVRTSVSQTTCRKDSDIRRTDASCRIMVTPSNGSVSISGGRSSNASAPNGSSVSPQNFIPENYRALLFCFSPGLQFSQEKNIRVVSTCASSCGRSQIDLLESSSRPLADKDEKGSGIVNSRLRTGFVASNGPIGQHALSSGACPNGGNNKLFFDPKNRLQNAPPYTLGGAALALHYANVILIVEKIVQYPRLINQDVRDDLYQMLPKNVRMALRTRLKSSMKGNSRCDDTLAADWKEALDRILGWLAPLAHNMIQWQSEHNFEQQQVVSRTNVLLLQTLYFADQLKAEAALTDLLVGLNYLWRYERELRTNALMEYMSSKDLDEYLKWQL